MAYPRSFTVDPEAPGFYHCISRCVRRAWLCGHDPLSGRNFDHRRGWIERRLIDLSESFSVGLYAWAVMSNHTHIVLRVDPSLPAQWSDEEVAFRWARLGRTLRFEPQDHVETRVRQLLRAPDRLAEIRVRLGSLSWFMRFLNECIAREANAEDRCTGRFWEGRFKCQALLDEASVLACMTYVDLNPIRAGIADTLADSDFTTIQRRLRSLEQDPSSEHQQLLAMAGVCDGRGPEITIGSYVRLLEWTGCIAKPDKRGRIPEDAPDALQSIRSSPDWWAVCVLSIESAFGLSVGTPRSLRRQAAATGRRFLRGVAL